MSQQAARLAGRRSAPGGDYESTMGNGPSRSSPLLFAVPVLVLVFLAIAIPLRMSLKPDRDVSVWRADKAKKSAGGATKLPEIDESAVITLSEENVAQAFLEAASWEERSKFVRDAGEVSAHLESYPEEVKAYPIECSGLRSLGAEMPGGVINSQRYSVRMSSGGLRFLWVVHTQEGPRVDYDAFARYATRSWADLLAGKPAAEVRVMAEKDLYFNNRFQDEAQWTCFKLTSPDWPKTAWGYARSGSITAELLSGIVSSRSQRVTLALRSEDDSQTHSQFVIDRVVINGWVRTPLDPEESLRMRLGR